MPSYTQHARLQTAFDAYAILPHENWNRLADGVDLQTWGLGQAIRDGIISGGQILPSKEVGPTIMIVGGMYGATTSNQAIADLVNGKTNIVWACRVDPPSAGGEFDLSHASTFNVGTVEFKASDVQPANSVRLGIIVLDNNGNVTQIDQSSSGNWPQHVIGTAVYRVLRNVTIEDLPYGEAFEVTVDHAEEAVFLIPGAVIVTPTEEGVTISNVQNHRPDAVSFSVTAEGAGGYGYTTTVHLTVVRYGIVRPSPWIWDYGS